mmetsp:Transcript_51136/g.136514  ORF Transcript_51136/g.136514 Transcript_51136/m.136514 type:complete len:209 (-) Transcript_51136:913-1539(-)
MDMAESALPWDRCRRHLLRVAGLPRKSSSGAHASQRIQRGHAQKIRAEATSRYHRLGPSNTAESHTIPNIRAHHDRASINRGGRRYTSRTPANRHRNHLHCGGHARHTTRVLQGFHKGSWYVGAGGHVGQLHCVSDKKACPIRASLGMERVMGLMGLVRLMPLVRCVRRMRRMRRERLVRRMGSMGLVRLVRLVHLLQLHLLHLVRLH